MKNRHKSIFSLGREIKWSFSLAALVELLLGLLLALAPNTSSQLLCTFIGIVVLAYGAFNILSYVLDRGMSAYTFELLLGILAAAFGIFVLCNKDFIIKFLFIVLGLIVLVSSIAGIKRALNLRAFGYPRWWAAMVSACATCLIAMSILLFPKLYGNMALMIIGIMLIVEAVSDLMSIRKLSHLAQDVDVTFTIHND